MNKTELFELLLGPGSITRLVAALIYAYVGAFLFLLFGAANRRPTDQKFSWNILLSENVRRILGTIILIFLFVRFSRELLGADLTMYLALLIGFGCDKLSGFLKSKNIF